MAKTLARELHRQYAASPQRLLEDLSEALRRGRAGEPGGITPQEFSIRDLAAWFLMADGQPIGHDGLAMLESGVPLSESSAVSSSAFAAVTQRIVTAQVLEGYAIPEAVLSRTIPTTTVRSRDPRVANFTLPLAGDKSLEYGEGVEKPLVEMQAEYVRPKKLTKVGPRLAITRETILFDETGQVLDAARRIGEFLALQKEQMLVDTVTGMVSGCVIEKRRTDSSEVTSDLFLTSGRWVNSLAANPFADWTDIDDIENTLLTNTLPGTSLPPMLMQRFILAPPQLRSRVLRTVTATETRSGSSNVVVAGNPLAGLGLTPIISPLVYSQQKKAGVDDATASGTWFYGDIARAFRWLEVWPLEVREVRDDRTNVVYDIEVEFVASCYGGPVVVEPRIWGRSLPS